MSRGTIALIALLGLATLVFVTVFALIVWALPLHPEGEPEADFSEVFWLGLMRALDPGNVAGDVGWLYRLAMMVVTIGGLIIVASLISIVSGGFDAKVAELRKGRSRVLESDHTLILGWNPKVFVIISELVLANESRGRSSIVVLAPRDKVELEDEIRAAVGPTGRTRVIVRSGDPMSPADLALGSPHTARSVILLGPEGADDPDAEVIKTGLALTGGRSGSSFHAVGEIRDPDNLEAARLVGRDSIEWVNAGDLIARLLVQASRQSGLSAVYAELLDFDGVEMYLTEIPELVGETFADIRMSFRESTPIGYLRAGRALLNPDAGDVLQAGDRVILIAEDDSTIAVTSRGAGDDSAIAPVEAGAPAPERFVVLGSNEGLGLMLTELDDAVVAGSRALLVADAEPPQLPSFRNLAIETLRADPTSRRALDALGLTAGDHIIVLADQHLPVQQADARTLITLLHVRDIAEAASGRFNVVSEMLDDANRELAEVTDADDFIVSDKLVALMLTQLSEAPTLASVFDVLFTSEGSELYLRPALDYVRADAEVDFFTVVEAAARRGETAIGYRVVEEGAADADPVVILNPRKDARRAFRPGDQVIVLAES